MSGMMQGKRGLIMGVANKNSIAWGIARACADAGAELAFTYQGEALEKRVFPLAESVGAKIIEPCDNHYLKNSKPNGVIWILSFTPLLLPVKKN